MTDFITPTAGPVTGGTSVEIASPNNLLDIACDDDFAAGSINPAKWTASTNGAGSAATQSGGRLHLSTGAVAGSYARIDSVATLLDTDIEVEFDVQTDVAALPAASPIEMAAVRLFIDANNYAQIARKTGGSFGNRYEVTVVVAGVTIESAFLSTSDLSGSLRIIRAGSTVYLLAGTTEVLRRSGFPTTAASARITVGNLTAAYAIATDFDDFFVHTMVVFGAEPMLDANPITSDRVLGTTPPGARVETVAIKMAICSAILPVFTNAFTYDDAARFTVLAPLSGAVSIAITNDPVLRNLRAGRPGFTR